MANLVKFESIDALCAELEKNYPDGLWLDMNDKESRKYAKDEAKNVNEVLKRINRTRIDAAKTYKASVDAEAKELSERINKSAKPLLELVESWKADRKVELDAEKEKKRQEQEELEQYRRKVRVEEANKKLFSQLMDLTGDVEIADKIIDALKNNQIDNVTWSIK